MRERNGRRRESKSNYTMQSVMLFLAMSTPATLPQVPEQPRPPLAVQAKLIVDPKNGYLDYVAAADLLMFAKKPNALTELQSGQSKRSTLGISRTIRSEFSGVFDHIVRGNQKSSWMAYSSYSFDTLLPELAYFKEIGRVLSPSIYAYLAEGNSSQAANVLREGLTFADNVSRGTLIHFLVGNAIFSILCAALDDLTLAFPPSDALALANSVTKLLDREPAIITAMEAEHLGLETVLLKDFERIGGVKGLFEQWTLSGGGDELDPLAREFQGYGPTQVKDLFQQVLARSKARTQRYRTMFLEPESNWKGLEPAAPPNSVVDWFERQTCAVADQAIEAGAIRRTQLRILRLHLAISAFYWEHRRLPNTLGELPQAGWTVDPVSSGPFQYEQTGRKDYRLYSRGTKRGEIDLVLKPRQPETQPGFEPPL